MWINALTVFKVENADTSQWIDAFSAYPLADPVGGQKKTYGFVPLGEEGIYVDQIDHLFAFVGALAERQLPKQAVDREVSKLVKANPDQYREGFDSDQVWCEVELRMLPNAPIRETRTPAIFCARSQLLYVFGQSKTGMEALLSSVRTSLGSFVCRPLAPRVEVQSLMTQWMTGEIPESIVLGNDAMLEVEDGSTTTFVGQDLEADIVLKHLEDGERVKRLSLIWNRSLHFELGHKGELKKIGPPGCKMKPSDAVLHWPEIMALLPQMIIEIGAHLQYDFDGCYEADAAASGETSPHDVSYDERMDDRTEDTSEPDETAEPRQSPATSSADLAPFHPLVLPSAACDVARVQSMLVRLAGWRRIDSLVVFKRPLDSYRAAYAWASANAVPVDLVEWNDLETWPRQATALVCSGSDSSIESAKSLAAHHGLKVMVSKQ